MKQSDKTKRYIVFYFSVALYILLLPIILSYSLGYHVDFHRLKVYKTGIISLKSNPSGASIYMNGKPLAELTPARIEELPPGTYKIEVTHDGFYVWEKELVVRPNMVTKAEDIILFPLIQEMKKISDNDSVHFVISDNKNHIYYMTRDGLFRSNMDGSNSKRLSVYSQWPAVITGERFSRDGNKFLFFNENGIWVVDLTQGKVPVNKDALAEVEEVVKGEGPIKDVFWYSGSNHIIFVSDKNIRVIELGGGGKINAVTLHACTRAPEDIYYDEDNDSLYFVDFKKDHDGRTKGRLYRIDLRQKFLDQLLERVKKEFNINYEKK